MSAELKGRALIEQRFGPLGCGERSLAVDGARYQLSDLLFRMGLNFDDAKPIDALTLAPGHFVVRYFDGQDSRVVACEFDRSFALIAETRAHIAEWIGDDALYSYYAGH